MVGVCRVEPGNRQEELSSIWLHPLLEGTEGTGSFVYSPIHAGVLARVQNPYLELSLQDPYGDPNGRQGKVTVEL